MYGSHKVLPINWHSFHYLDSAAQMSNYNVLPNPSVLMLKLNYYATFKTEFICEKYSFVIENYILKILMTKLRLGILNLEIVLGRYEGIPSYST